MLGADHSFFWLEKLSFALGDIFADGSVEGANFTHDFTGTRMFQDFNMTPATSLGDPVRLQLADNSIGNQPVAFLDGVTDSTFSTPNRAGLGITGAIDVRVRVSLPSLAPAANQFFASKLGTGGYSWNFGLLTDGTLRFLYSPSAGNNPSVSSTVTAASAGVPTGQPVWLRVAADPPNGTVNFYQSSDGSTWTPIGAQVATTAGNIFNSSTALVLGAGSDIAAVPMTGRIYRAIVKDGIDGTTVADFNPANYPGSGATLPDGVSGNWTRNGSAYIAPDGFHLVAPSDAARPQLARVPYGEGVRNLFAAFGKQNVVLIAGSSWNLSPSGQSTFQGTGDPAVLTPNWGGDPNATRVQLALNGGTQSSDRSGFSTTNFSVSTLTQTDFTASCRIAPHGSTTSSDLEMAAAGLLCFFAAGATSQETRLGDNGDGTYTIANTSLGIVATNGSIRFQLQGNVGPDTLDFILYNDSVQLDMGAEATPAQRVTAAYDITQSGIPSVPCLYNNLSNSQSDMLLPADDYEVIFAGNLGIWNDSVAFAGGTFSYGPTSYTNGPAGIIANTIGQYELGSMVIRGALTDQQRSQVNRWFMQQKGAPWVWERSAELFSGTITLGTGWSDNGGGSYTHASGTESVLATGNPVSAGELVRCNFTISGNTSGTIQVVTNSTDAVSGNFGSNGIKSQIGVAAAAGPLGIRATSSSPGTVSDISLKSLTRNTSP